MKQLKFLVPGFSLLGLVASGCASQPAKPAETAAVRSDVSDIRPIEATPSAFQAPQPVTYDTTPAVAPAPAASSATPANRPVAGGSVAGGNTHVVKRGETLYSIARQSYGDGKQWQKIAMANPGVSPGSLKVGQSLIVP